MKRLYVLFLASIALSVACNNKPKQTATFTTDDGKGQVTVDMKEMQKAAEDMQKQKTDLEKLAPLTLDQLKALIPETLMGVPRKSYEASAAMGAGVANGRYEINDSMDVKLSIFDCAGPGGAGIYSMQYLSMIDIQQESDDEYTKTIDFNGGKAHEHCNKSSNDCTFTYFAGGRFLVTLEGDHVSADALKQAAKGLNIK
jgi:hypothetical protein